MERILQDACVRVRGEELYKSKRRGKKEKPHWVISLRDTSDPVSSPAHSGVL